MNSELESIDDYAFSNTSIESISIPQSVSFIGQYVFYSEKSTLKTVEFIENSNLKFLSNKAFANTSIESIAIPEEFAGIRNGIFCYTPNLVDIKIVSSRYYTNNDDFDFGCISYYDNKFIIGKSCKNEDNYDILLFEKMTYDNICNGYHTFTFL